MNIPLYSDCLLIATSIISLANQKSIVMNNNFLKGLGLLLLTLVLALPASAQEKGKFNVAADIYSRYVWRGADYGAAPSIQPAMAYAKGRFEIGSWGAYSVRGNYSETDLYAKCTIKGFSVIATDYFIHNEISANNTHYFDYSKNATSHAIEGALQYKNPGKYPFSILAGTYVYGNDKRWGYDVAKDSTGENYYSTYVELGYSLKCGGNNYDLFLGLTPQAGAYGNTFGVVNAGISGYKTIEVTEKFQIPVKASVIANPQAGNLFFVIGITL